MTPGPDSSSRRPPGAPKPPPAGSIVIPDQHPAGYPRWRVLPTTKATSPSDILNLETTDPASPVKQIRRRASTLRPTRGT